MQKTTHYPGVDLLRFIAAFWVMSFHYLNNLSGTITWYRYGNLGVPLFFIISGFVITQSVGGRTIKQFAVNRFIRLFPFFWIACTGTYILTLLAPEGHPVRFAEYLISMTMLGDKLSSALGYGGLVDPVYWSLSVELIFYSAIALFVSVFSIQNIRYFLVSWLAISMLAFGLHHQDLFAMKLLLVRHAAYFIFGATIALIAKDKQESVKIRILDLLLLASTAIFATFISPLSLPPYFGPNPSDTLIVEVMQPFFFVIFLILLSISPLLSFNKKLLAMLSIIGGMTYPLYLLHQTIGNTLLAEAYGIAPKNLLVFSCMILMICVSYVAYRFDEKLRNRLHFLITNKSKGLQ